MIKMAKQGPSHQQLLQAMYLHQSPMTMHEHVWKHHTECQPCIHNPSESD
jgi:hypothetical protein